MKVLIYDDEAEFADYVREAIEDLGHSVTVATNAGEFADRFSVETDLIFLDLFMPDVNGIECIRFLAETGTNALLVLMSGQDPAILNAAREGARANKLAVLDVMNKPIGLMELEKTLELAEAELATTVLAKAASTNEPAHFLREDILQGLARKEFFLVYQPQLRLDNRSVIGVEALIRWDRPEHGLVSPAHFIPVLESDPAAMGTLTDFVIETACRDQKDFTRIAPHLTCSVNLSAATFEDISLPDRILQVVHDAGLQPAQLILEVAETAASSHVGTAIDILTRLRMAGFGVSIDDFGTGYSSLEQIVHVPYTELKVDQRFVRDILDSAKCRAICEISCLLAQKTDMTPLAEGVEDEKTALALLELGFVLAQGFHFAKPMRSTHLKSWLQSAVAKGSTREKADLAMVPFGKTKG
ncbi:EAL domain-containing response regulator [Roseibium sp. Sym1]|uniref:EAL domain-containing response regulator n=1 Tax=Roseibium sp. Sym1 TaxID=3016006 RepID=UPI0022B487D2|nr:EAL domain-containing response regulator [Roseibium sp. Sym1]